MKKIFIAAFVIACFALLSAYAAPVPDTGQTGDYTATWGEDSDYDINPHSYNDLGNGIVRDNVTGLEWQQATAYGSKWDTANTYCDNLVLGGHDDWRLPTIKELSTLVDNNIHGTSPYDGPAIDTDYFPDTEMEWGDSSYWSSTTYDNDTSNAWYVEFSLGAVEYESKTSGNYVRAVRGGPLPANSFIDNGDGTVTDITTGLVWQQATDLVTYTWEEALVYCENLNIAGYNDWRLPNRNELQSIVNYSTYNPSIDTAHFSGTVASTYWSSTTLAPYGQAAWFVIFNDGVVFHRYKTIQRYVRAVRGGQCGYYGDSDLDDICDDGDASGVPGDNPCTGGNTVFCDDNCPDDANADQADADSDGIGDVCDETLIELSSFTATRRLGKVVIDWTTDSEIDNAGFNILKSDTEDGEYTQINEELIPADGSATSGADYEYVDRDVRLGQNCWYILEDVALDGTATQSTPVSVTWR